MKRHKKIIIAFLALVSLGLASCLKDSPNNADPSKSNNVVEFQNSSIPVSYTSIYPQYDNSVIFAPDTGGFNVNVNYAGPQFAAPQDIQVTVALDTAALTAFNADQSKSYVVPPVDIYTVAPTVTIARGTQDAHIRVIIKLAPDYNYSVSYALPLKITAASYGAISSNFGTAIYSFIGRNKYDGSYSLKEKLTGWSAYGIDDGTTYTWPNNIGFVTSGATSNTTLDANWGSGQLGFVASGGTTAFGATKPQYTFDASTNKLTAVVNLSPNDGRGRAFQINSAVTGSGYDPTTKTITAAYIMFQNGRPNQYIYDTLTYVGVR